MSFSEKKALMKDLRLFARLHTEVLKQLHHHQFHDHQSKPHSHAVTRAETKRHKLVGADFILGTEPLKKSDTSHC